MAKPITPARPVRPAIVKPGPPKPVRPSIPPKPLLPPGAKLIPAMAESAPDPLAGLPQIDNPEESCAAELGAVEQGFRDRKAAEEARREVATDGEFWFAVCAFDRPQKVAFLAALGIDPERDGDKYLDIRVLHEAINRRIASGVPLEPLPAPVYRAPQVKPDRRLAELAGIPAKPAGAKKT